MQFAREPHIVSFDIPPRDPRLIRRVALVGGAIVLLLLALGSFYTVDTAEHAIVFNRVSGSLRETDNGLHFKVPLVEEVHRYETRVQTYDADAEGASNDLQVVHIQIAVRFQPEAGAITEIHQTLGPGYQDRVIRPSVQESVKAATARYNAAQLIELRPAVKLDIEETLRESLAASRVTLVEVLITNFDFSVEFNAAIESKVVARQQAEQANNTLLRVQYEAQQKVVQAQADLDAARLQAQQKVVQADADRQAAQLVTEGLSDDYLQFLRVQRWNGVLPTTYLPQGAGNETSILVGIP